MAIDSQAKRMSAIGASIPVPSLLPASDGTVGDADRYHLAWVYSGLVSEVVTVLYVVSGDVAIRLLASGVSAINETVIGNAALRITGLDDAALHLIATGNAAIRETATGDSEL